jgi:hypothetical protein
MCSTEIQIMKDKHSLLMAHVDHLSDKTQRVALG